MATDPTPPPEPTAKAEAPPPAEQGPRRRRWVPPEIRDFGSTRRLVRGATGHYGDPGAMGVGKRSK